MGSKLKCVVRHFMDMESSDKKWLQLATFFAGVRACDVGKNTAIQDWYMGLPSKKRIQAKSSSFDVDNELQPALCALRDTIQSVVSSQFSPESLFMKKICGENDIKQAAHQIQFVKGQIGDKVGLSEGPRFDINAHTIYQSILRMTPQEMIQLYYEHIKVESIVPLLVSTFNRALVQSDGLDKGVHDSIVAMFPGNKSGRFLSYEDIEGTEGWFVSGINEAGMIQLLTHKSVGIFEEVNQALPWAAPQRRQALLPPEEDPHSWANSNTPR